MKPRLTKRAVDAAKPGSLLWDRDLPGFGMRTTRAGTKSYVLKYRFHNRQRWFTIGQHGQPSAGGGVWTPHSAREAATTLLGRVKAGHDPAQALEAERKAETLAAFAKRYVHDHVEAHSKPRSAKETKRLLSRHVLPALGHVRIKDIQRSDVVRFHLGMKATPYQANRCLALISHMLGKAEQWGVCANGSTVCRGITKFKEAKRERFLSASELNRLGAALEAAEVQGVTSLGVSIIRLLALTGARRNEIESLKWSEVDFERGIIRLEDSKTGAKVIPLTPAAAVILDGTARMAGSPYVFPALSGGGYFQGLGKIWRAVRKQAGLEDVRLHDLRHTFASFGVAGGFNLPVLGAILGHTQAATTQRYAHLANDPVLHAANNIGQTIAAALNGQKSADVVPLNASVKKA